MQYSDEKLVEQYINGDKKALEILVQNYLRSIYGFVYNRTRSVADAEEITQEIFVRIWRNIKKFDISKSSFRIWIFTIAKNLVIDFLRKNKEISFSALDANYDLRFSQNFAGESNFADTLVDPMPIPSEFYEEKSNIELIKSIVKNLPKKYQNVLVSRHEKDLTFSEIASRANESTNTVKSRYRRAILAIKKILAINTD